MKNRIGPGPKSASVIFSKALIKSCSVIVGCYLLSAKMEGTQYQPPLDASTDTGRNRLCVFSPPRLADN